MSSRRSVSVAAFLLMALAGALGCNTANSGAALTSPTKVKKSIAGSNAVLVDPVSIRGRSLPGAWCGGYPPFAAQFSLVFPPTYGFGWSVNAITFSYLDQRGSRVVPFAIPGTPQGGITTTGIPSNGPILVPGQVGSIFFVNPSSRGVIPYSVRFDCGFARKGTLSIRLDTIDQLGGPGSEQLAVSVIE